MGWNVKNTIMAVIKKYKYTVLILLLGVGLMLWPQTGEGTTEPVVLENTDLEDRLENLLSQVEGAGEVRVLLTYAESASHKYQTDQKSETETETVLVSGGGTQTPLTVSTRYPTYQGAVILCQGADSASVRLDLVKAVSDLTGLSSDKISVIKMKQQ